MGQKAFYFDMTTCVGCHACQVACRDRNGLYNPGEIFRKVDTYEGGKFPTPWFFPLSIACNHCAKPACVAICPTGAMYKDEETGLVLLDSALCDGCGLCTMACPYKEPILLKMDEKTVCAKCDGCYTNVKKGENPVCVDACNMRSLQFGDLEELQKEHPDAVSNLVCLPDASMTTPSLLITPLPEAIDGEVEQVF